MNRCYFYSQITPKTIYAPSLKPHTIVWRLNQTGIVFSARCLQKSSERNICKKRRLYINSKKKLYKCVFMAEVKKES
jgi:hypothetical protein